MKRILFFLLKPTFGSKRFHRFYSVMRNIALQGLNFRNNDIATDGELFYLKSISRHYGENTAPLVLFDVGANVGDYSRLLNDTFRTHKKKIYSFEPFSKAYADLKKLEQAAPEITAVNLGLGEKREKVTFLSSSEYSKVGGLYNKDFSEYNFSLNIREEASFDTIDNFCADHQIDRIHLLKVDVEGHDFFALKGAENMLKTNRIDFIQFEYGAANYLSKTYLYDFFQLLAPNYHLCHLLKNGYFEIREYNTDIEIHLLTNYVAINKSLPFKLN